MNTTRQRHSSMTSFWRDYCKMSRIIYKNQTDVNNEFEHCFSTWLYDPCSKILKMNHVKLMENCL